MRPIRVYNQPTRRIVRRETVAETLFRQRRAAAAARQPWWTLTLRNTRLINTALVTLFAALVAVVLLHKDTDVHARAFAMNGALVIDGDTIDVDGEHIRLPHVDTPEVVRCRCAAECTQGQAAREFTATALTQGKMSVDRTGATDPKGRTLGYVQVNGNDVGTMLIKAGLARQWQGKSKGWCPS